MSTAMKQRKHTPASQTPTPLFVGQYRRPVGAQGRIRFPSGWLPMLGEDRELFVLSDPNGTKSLLVVLAADYRKESNSPPATLLKVASNGLMRIPMQLLARVGITSVVRLLGKIRMVELSAISPAT